MTLEFENARILQSLYGGDETLLRKMEQKLGVHITTRDGWLKIEGPDAALALARLSLIHI